MRQLTTLLGTLLLVGLTYGCKSPATSNSSPTLDRGEAGQACYPNETCNDGLACVDGVCQAAPRANTGSACGSLDPQECFLDAVKGGEDRQEKYEASCEQGFGIACHTLGKAFRGESLIPLLGRTVDRDKETALSHFRSGCDAGYGPSCYEAGKLHLDEGSPVEFSTYRAIRFFDRACFGGYSPACIPAAKMRQEEPEGGAVLKAAFWLYDADPAELEFEVIDDEAPREIETQSFPLWTLMGQFKANGHGLEKAPAEATTIFSQGCRNGEGVACSLAAARKLADYERKMQDNPQGVAEQMLEQERKNAMNLAEIGCLAHETASSCILHVMLAPDSPNRARMLRTACTTGSLLGCEMYGDLLTESGDLAEAKKIYGAACRGGRKSACSKD